MKMVGFVNKAKYDVCGVGLIGEKHNINFFQLSVEVLVWKSQPHLLKSS